ncbi:hypothetical protein [Ignavibacterium album]|uniref:phosphoribosyltransferase-like protein n=1 Tax=Ignavibacterium album TaxID=591197 RepID=UPI0035BB895C
MNVLIDNIFHKIKDYRADEGDTAFVPSHDRIKKWIIQFPEDTRIPILTELDNIFSKRYISKERTKIFLKNLIEHMAKEFKFENIIEFLKNAQFLSLQQEGKSQRVLLSMLDELIIQKYNFKLSQCGSDSKRYSIYLDDILCTGLTLMLNLSEWVSKPFSNDKTNKEAISQNLTTLVCCYIIVHRENYRKKIAEIKHKLSIEFAEKHRLFQGFMIENDILLDSKIDLIHPTDTIQLKEVEEYKSQISELVESLTKRNNWKTNDNYYRPSNLPAEETFFTSPQNRIIVENAFLLKGIEILKSVNVKKSNMRALGYSLPSSKNFGFGALSFTWRNIPNNTPLVFWYVGKGFLPLFEVKRGSNVKSLHHNISDYDFPDL